MSEITIFLILMAVSLEYFDIAQKITFFSKSFRVKEITSFFVITILFQIGFMLLGYLLGSYIATAFNLNTYWFFVVIATVLAIKMIIQGFKDNPLKRAANPIGFKNQIQISLALGINLFVLSISLGYFTFAINNLVLYIFIVHLFVTFVGFSTGLFRDKLIPLKLELFSGILILGLIIQYFIYAIK